MKSELFSTIILVFIVAAYFTLKSRKAKNASWKGELIKKKDITDEDNENHMYRLIFKTDSGKEVKVTVNEETYTNAQIGNKYQKASGEKIPKKILG